MIFLLSLIFILIFLSHWQKYFHRPNNSVAEINIFNLGADTLKLGPVCPVDEINLLTTINWRTWFLLIEVCRIIFLLSTKIFIFSTKIWSPSLSLQWGQNNVHTVETKVWDKNNVIINNNLNFKDVGWLNFVLTMKNFVLSQSMPSPNCSMPRRFASTVVVLVGIVFLWTMVQFFISKQCQY